MSFDTHANTPSTSRDEQPDEQKLSARPTPAYVKADDGIDGSRWHPVETVDEGDYRADDVIVTECGLRVEWLEADEIVMPDEPKPHFSGNSICYGCVQ